MATHAKQPAIAYSIIVPVYNEAKRLQPALEKLHHYTQSLQQSWELIFVDDGSTDDTVAKIAQYTQLKSQTITLHRNTGKGGAVKEGMLSAQGAYRAFIDADMATPPQELTKLFSALEQGADIAIGSRINEQGIDLRHVGTKPQSLTRRIMGKAFRLVATRPFLGNIRDSQCGAKAFTAEAAQTLFPQQQINRWAFDIELLYLAKKMKLKVVEVPVDWSAQEDSKLKPSVALAFSTLKELLTIAWIHR